MNRKIVFGLSVDDELTCGFAEVIAQHGKQGDAAFPGLLGVAKLADLPNAGPEISLGVLILERMSALRRDNPEIADLLDRTSAVGVSSIGLIDRQQYVLRDVRRKPWRREKLGHFLNIRNIVQQIFGRSLPISAHNDATAKCMAYRRFLDMDGRAVLCCIMMSQGVNIGVASEVMPLSVSDMHPEMGHSYPILHEGDRKLDEKKLLVNYSGCPIHVRCYEGVASGARLDKHREHPPLVRDRHLADPDLAAILSDYLGQLCWTLTLSIAPSRIVLGGSSMNSDLLDGIRRKFMALNRGPNEAAAYLSTSAYPALREDASTFIQIAPTFERLAGHDIHDPDGVMGALEVGRMALVHNVFRPEPLQ